VNPEEKYSESWIPAFLLRHVGCGASFFVKTSEDTTEDKTEDKARE